MSLRKFCSCETVQSEELLRLRDDLIKADARLKHLLEASKRVVSTPQPSANSLMVLATAVTQCS